MAKSIFRDKGVQPGDEMVVSALKASEPLWDELVRYAFDALPGAAQEWKFYGAAWGWCLVLSGKKKKLVYLTPADGRFLCSFSFGEKGRGLARQAGFDATVLETIEAGKDNPAGRMFDIAVENADTLELAKRLLEIKTKT